jgi:hypothetical protein
MYAEMAMTSSSERFASTFSIGATAAPALNPFLNADQLPGNIDRLQARDSGHVTEAFQPFPVTLRALGCLSRCARLHECLSPGHAAGKNIYRKRRVRIAIQCSHRIDQYLDDPRTLGLGFKRPLHCCRCRLSYESTPGSHEQRITG